MRDIEESIRKGNDFEHYIARLFDEKDQFTIVSWTTDIMRKHRNIKVEDDKNPDLKIRDNRDKEFFVECKFRSNLYKGALTWSNRYQLERYEIDEMVNEYFDETPTYVIIGLYGDANQPDHLYGIPLKEIQYPKLYPSIFEKYEIDTNFKYLNNSDKEYML
ncbi:hypothetical protein [Methanococcoides sp.]|uniref:hypothetical protein n=1 Tax=Methanococcoides sp. TaxID=1966350 RepID=UPI00272DFC34|nr:hypothetical protein [Methanococcoides sp.]